MHAAAWRPGHRRPSGNQAEHFLERPPAPTMSSTVRAARHSGRRISVWRFGTEVARQSGAITGTRLGLLVVARRATTTRAKKLRVLATTARRPNVACAAAELRAVSLLERRQPRCRRAGSRGYSRSPPQTVSACPSDVGGIDEAIVFACTHAAARSRLQGGSAAVREVLPGTGTPQRRSSFQRAFSQ